MKRYEMHPDGVKVIEDGETINMDATAIVELLKMNNEVIKLLEARVNQLENTIKAMGTKL